MGSLILAPKNAECITKNNLYYNKNTNNFLVHHEKDHAPSIDGNWRFKSVPVNEVTYINAFGDYNEIHYTNGTRDVVKGTMKEISKGLFFFELFFLRVHRSYIINLKFVEAKELKRDFVCFRKNYIKEESEKITIPFGRVYTNGTKLREFLFG